MLPQPPDLRPLLIRFGRLGDMVLQTPLLHLLHKRYGLAPRLLSSGPWSHELLTGNRDVHEIWSLRRRHLPLLLDPERWLLISKLRNCRGPIYVSEDAERQVKKVRRLLAMAGIDRERSVFIGDLKRDKEHWVDRLLQFGNTTPRAFAGYTKESSLDDLWTAPRLPVFARDRIDRDAWLAQRNFADRPIVLVQIGNKRSLKWRRARENDTKAWPTSYWISLLRFVRQAMPQALILLCGSPSEQKLLLDVKESTKIDALEVAASDMPIRRLLAVMEIAHSMVSVDTGPAHMAAAVGCPLVVLYGSESREVWGRRSADASPIVELGGTLEYCEMSQIQPETVIGAWSRVCRQII